MAWALDLRCQLAGQWRRAPPPEPGTQDRGKHGGHSGHSGLERLAAQGQPFADAKIPLTYLAARPLIYVTVNGKVEPTHPASWSPPLPEWRPSR